MDIKKNNRPQSEDRVSLGLDVGGTKMAGILMTADGSIVAKEAQYTLASEGGNAVLERLIVLAEKLLDKSKNCLMGIGVATPGIVDADNQFVRFISTEIPGWRNLPIAQVLSSRFGVRVLIENDGRMAALAEHHLGVGRGCENFVTIVLGTGVGGGIVANNEILSGGHGGGGRLGHISVDPRGPICSCGNRGCLELYASGTALAEAFRAAISQNPYEFSIGKFLDQQSEEFSGRNVIELAESGNDLARTVLEHAGEKLGLAMVQVIRMMDPEKIVIGGSISAAGDLLIVPARHVLSTYCPEEFPFTPSIEKAKFGRDASVVGAALLGWQAFERNPEIS